MNSFWAFIHCTFIQKQNGSFGPTSDNVALWFNLNNNRPWLYQSERIHCLWIWNKHSRLTISHSATASPLPNQRVCTLQTRVTLKTSKVGLFNYCVLMIKWEQHNGLINFLITVSTKSNYNQIHRLVNHTSIKLKQPPLGSNHFQTEQMSRLAQTSASGRGSVYLRTVSPRKGYSGR